MPVGLIAPESLDPVKGIQLATGFAGVRKSGTDDLTLMALCEGSSTAAVFTRNAFCAAPVLIARQYLAQQSPRFLMINAGNANAGTGDAGMRDAHGLCQHLADTAGCEARQVLPFSTGVIGERLPCDSMLAAIPDTVAKLGDDNWLAAAHAIMTTDIVPKGLSRKLDLDGLSISITGIAKGSGMIRPDMATMLSFIGTDVAISPALLQQCLEHAVERSFNRITVDGETSTNDACVLVATGKAGNPNIDSDTHPHFALLQQAIDEVCVWLAQAIVRDGEGATRFVTVTVDEARTRDEACAVAYTIAHSPLVKTAIFGQDPNWGRILAAVGRAGVDDLQIDDVKIHLGDVCIVRDGGRDPDYTEEMGLRVMAESEISIRVALGRGNVTDTVWTSDLSYDYVKINADYRT